MENVIFRGITAFIISSDALYAYREGVDQCFSRHMLDNSYVCTYSVQEVKDSCLLHPEFRSLAPELF
jgi:hypothetical protein